MTGLPLGWKEQNWSEVRQVNNLVPDLTIFPLPQEVVMMVKSLGIKQLHIRPLTCSCE